LIDKTRDIAYQNIEWVPTVLLCSICYVIFSEAYRNPSAGPSVRAATGIMSAIVWKTIMVFLVYSASRIYSFF
jgi:hypothetical protein